MEPVDRRDFIKTVAGTAAFAALEGSAAMPPDAGPIFLSTWVWGKAANERAAEVFKSGGSLLDAVEKGINVPESDPNVTRSAMAGYPMPREWWNSMRRSWTAPAIAPAPCAACT